MLTKQDKQNIYGLFADEYKKNQIESLNEVEFYLKKQGLNPQEFGYQSMLKLLEDLSEFLTVDKSAGKDQPIKIIFHDYTEKQKKPSNSSKPKKTQLTANDHKEIYDLLTSKFNTGVEYPMATISKYLLESAVDYKKYGFKQMKALLLNLKEEVSLKDVNLNGTPQSLVIITPKKDSKTIDKERPIKKEVKTKDKKKSKENKQQSKETISKPLNTPKKEEQKETKSQPVKQTSNKNDIATSSTPKKNKIKNTSKNDLFVQSKGFYIPPKILNSIKESAPLGLDDNSIKDLLWSDYQKALKENNVKIKDGNIIFDLSFKNRKGDDLIASIRQSSNSTTSYSFYLNYVGDCSTKAKDTLKGTIFFSEYDKEIAELANLARKEKWCYLHSKDEYIILKIYLQYTFARIMSQNLFVYNKNTKFGAFNTGLVSEDYRDIYGIVQKNNLPDAQAPYIFQGFAVAGSQGYGKILVESFNPLPKRPTYFSSFDEIYYDSTAQLFPDYNHIIFDNLDRFPISFLKRNIMPFPEEYKILSDIIKTKAPAKKEFLYKKLSDALRKNETLYNFFRASLYTTIQRAKRIVKDDYKMVLPSFFPTRNVISMMLPLIFDTTKGPEAVLLVEHSDVGNYQGQTMLTLKQCYVNARLIGPLEHTFLNPEKIED